MSSSMRAFATTSLVGLALSTASCPGQGASTHLEVAQAQLPPTLAGIEREVAARFVREAQATMPEDEALVLEADSLAEGPAEHVWGALSNDEDEDENEDDAEDEDGTEAAPPIDLLARPGDPSPRL